MKRLLPILLIIVWASLAFAGTAALTWTASATPGVTQYNVYSTYTAGTYGATPLAVVNALAYTDASSGTGECYVVTATLNGLESVYSNEVCYLRPLPPGLLKAIWGK